MPFPRMRWTLPLLGALAVACDGGTEPDPLDGVIEGTVHIEGTPLAGVEVSLSPADGAPGRIGITASDGSFVFEALEAGDFGLRLTAVPDEVDVDRVDARATLDRVSPTARVDFTGRFRRDASISVQVMVEGSGVPSLDVVVSGPDTRHGVTDGEGTAFFPDLRRGLYEVAISGFDPERLAFSVTQATVEAAGPVQAGLEFSGVEVPRAPSAPSAFTAEAEDARSVALAWTDLADNEDGFEIERADGVDGPWAPLATADADATTWTDETVIPAGSWRYRLRACNEHGCSEPWREAAASTPDVPPVAPADLVGAATGPSRVALSWTDASANETSFEIERRIGAGGAWTARVALEAEATGFVDDGLAAGTDYGYRIRACNDVGCSPWTAPVQVTTVVVPPAAPQGVSATATDHDRVEVAWSDASADETEFRLERSAAGGPWSDRATLPAGTTAFVDATVAGATTYAYRVFACNSAGCSDPSAEATTTTPSPPPNLDVAAAYVVQRVQRPEGDVPLVAGLDGLLRVFPRGNRTGLPATSVRVELFQGTTPVQTTTLAPPVGTMPTAMDESDLGASWNLTIPGSLIQPNLGMRITVDPDDAFVEGDESDNTVPADGGILALDVRETPRFEVTFVPVRQSANNTVGSVSAGTMDSFLADARRLMPYATDDAQLHAEFTTDQPVLSSDGTGWSAVLSEVAALRSAEGSSRAYYGVVPTTYSSGVAGIGYIGWPIALGWDRGGKASVATHEWGHNFGRRHSPGCGAGSPDGSYPHAGGRIGAWGWDAPTTSLRSPSTYFDLMTYCGPEWISDYVYEKVLAFRGPAPDAGTPAAAPSAAVDGLLIWGRVEGDAVVLEPSFQVRAPVRLPDAPGRFRLEGLAGGAVVFALSFDPTPVADGPGDEGHFAFVVPLSPGDVGRLEAIRLGDGRRLAVRTEAAFAAPGARSPAPQVAPVAGDRVEVAWDAGRHPLAVIRDAATGQILSLARSGRTVLRAPGPELTISLSDGLRTVETRTARWR